MPVSNKDVTQPLRRLVTPPLLVPKDSALGSTMVLQPLPGHSIYLHEAIATVRTTFTVTGYTINVGSLTVGAAYGTLAVGGTAVQGSVVRVTLADLLEPGSPVMVVKASTQPGNGESWLSIIYSYVENNPPTVDVNPE